MKRIIIKNIAIILAVFMVSSCEWEAPMFDSADSFIAYASSTSSVAENGGMIGIPVLVTADLSAPAVSVTFEFDAASPAKEGEHFTLVNPSKTLDISAGWGYDTIWIQPIDNDVFTGNLVAIINLVSNTGGYPFGVVSTHNLNIVDDEHPLKDYIGTYSVTALSYGQPGVWDENWTVTAEPVEGEVTVLAYTINTGGGGGEPFYAEINQEDMTITIQPGTDVGDIYGYGPTAMYVGDFTYLDIESSIVGSIEADGTILIDELTMILSDYGFVDGLWDAFNTTWTKTGKKSALKVDALNQSRINKLER